MDSFYGWDGHLTTTEGRSKQDSRTAVDGKRSKKKGKRHETMSTLICRSCGIHQYINAITTWRANAADSPLLTPSPLRVRTYILEPAVCASTYVQVHHNCSSPFIPLFELPSYLNLFRITIFTDVF